MHSQTIEDADLKGITQSLRAETATSTVSGPLSTTTGGASQEDPKPDPNATYAQVNIENVPHGNRRKGNISSRNNSLLWIWKPLIPGYRTVDVVVSIGMYVELCMCAYASNC